ncbi:MAG TPA: VWA domain-containing protein [Polyangia bacterium]|nr:VWA domain-containing protein [Polyangia bacterium]
MLTLLPCALLMVANPSPAPPVHRVAISVRGPLALVEVERTLVGEDARKELVWDVALPDGAAVLDWRVVADKGALRLKGADPTMARADHAADLAARSVAASRDTIDEGTDFRLHLAGLAPGQRALLRYRYSAPLACRRGRFLLRVPGTLEADPVPADVTVSIAATGGQPVELDLAGVSSRSGTSARGRAPARAAWEVSFALRGSRHAEPILAAAGRGPSETTVALGICRSDDPAPAALPERVLLLIDRSRSVGPAGIAMERDLARALMEALPPSVHFNAVLFDRVPHPLFPLARAATAEALAALDDQTGASQLQNGTSLPKALHAAAELARFDGQGRDASTWLVLITDGAVPEGERAEALLSAVSTLPAARTDALVLLARPSGDEPAAAAAQELLRALPAHLGGVLRTVDPADLRGSVAEIVASARRGGDLFGLAVAAGARRSEAFSAIPPGGGQTRVLRVPGGGAPSVSGHRRGEVFTMPLPAARLSPAALAPQLGSVAAAWIGSDGRLAGWVETAAGPPPLLDDVPRGQMDRQVVRNSLSLAYMPRARACYLGRAVHGAADFDLRGRLRLELHLERGEMVEAVVRQSTLKRPEIEACLREAAFGVEIPRPLHRDAPVVAALNLIFQPRTTPVGKQDASPLGKEIDLILGPVSFPSDGRDLLEDPPAP